MNVLGVRRIIELAKKMTNLEVCIQCLFRYCSVHFLKFLVEPALMVDAAAVGATEVGIKATAAIVVIVVLYLASFFEYLHTIY